MNRDSMIIFGVIGALFLILLVMFLMTAEMFEGYRDRRKAMRKKKKMPVRKKRAARKMRRRRN